MVDALVPDSVDITVESFTTIERAMTLALDGMEGEFTGVAIISFKGDRDDVRFRQTEALSTMPAAVFWYGLVIMAYVDLPVANIDFKIYSGGKYGTLTVSTADLVAGSVFTVSLSEDDDSGDDNVSQS